MERDTLSLGDYLAVLRRRWAIIILSVVVLGALAAAFSLQQSPLYHASAQVALGDQTSAPVPGVRPTPSSPQAAQRFAQTEAILGESPAVAKLAIKEAKVDRTVSELLSRSNVQPNPNANILTFNVNDRDRTVATKLATAYAKAFTMYEQARNGAAAKARLATVDTQLKADISQAKNPNLTKLEATILRRQISSLEGQQSALNGYLDTTLKQSSFIASNADPANQTQPNTSRNIAIGLAVGLLLGLLLAFLRDALDNRLRSSGEVREALELPVLARIPTPRRALRRSDKLAMLAEPEGASAEAFRTLRAKLAFAADGRHQTVMVTSPSAGDGKSTTIANLAVASAEAGRAVILVDLDMPRPFLHRFFGLQPAPGISDVVAGSVSLDEALLPIDVPFARGNGGRAGAVPGGSLHVLTVGSALGHPVGVLTSARLAALLSELRDRCDVILVDAPPLLPSSHAVILSAMVDAILTVARADRLDRDTIEEVQAVLGSLPTPRLGYVMTGVAAGHAYTSLREARPAPPSLNGHREDVDVDGRQATPLG